MTTSKQAMVRWWANTTDAAPGTPRPQRILTGMFATANDGTVCLIADDVTAASPRGGRPR
jgi:hypothetical protein